MPVASLPRVRKILAGLCVLAALGVIGHSWTLSPSAATLLISGGPVASERVDLDLYPEGKQISAAYLQSTRVTWPIEWEVRVPSGRYELSIVVRAEGSAARTSRSLTILDGARVHVDLRENDRASR